MVGAAGIEPALSGCIARGATVTLSAVAPAPDRRGWNPPGADLESTPSVAEVLVSPRRVYTTTGANRLIHQTL